MPGIAASTKLTWVFGSAPNAVADEENSLALEVTCEGEKLLADQVSHTRSILIN